MAMTHSERQKKFREGNIRRVYIDLNVRTDADIIAGLDKQPSRQGFIKQALREYIANHPEEPQPNE